MNNKSKWITVAATPIALIHLLLLFIMTLSFHNTACDLCEVNLHRFLIVDYRQNQSHKLPAHLLKWSYDD